MELSTKPGQLQTKRFMPHSMTLMSGLLWRKGDGSILERTFPVRGDTMSVTMTYCFCYTTIRKHSRWKSVYATE